MIRVSGPARPERDLEGLDGAGQGAAVVDVDDRIARGAEDVPEVQHVRRREVHEGIAVGVGGRGEERAHLLAVEVEAHGVVVGHDGPRPGRRWWREAAAPAREAESLEHPDAHVVVGEDQDVGARQRLVAADVVRVHVGVDEEADLAVRDGPHRRDQPLGERREQRVDEEHPVRAREDSDVAAPARPREHVHVAGGGHDGQLDPREPVGRVLLGGRERDDDAGGRERGRDETGMPGHCCSAPFGVLRVIRNRMRAMQAGSRSTAVSSVRSPRAGRPRSRSVPIERAGWRRSPPVSCRRRNRHESTGRMLPSPLRKAALNRSHEPWGRDR